MAEFTGRTVIVTGGAGTLGRAISLAFAQAGANVIINDLGCSADGEGSSVEVAEAVAENIRQMTGATERVVACPGSVMEADKIVDTALSRFGRIDVLVNAVGMLWYGPFEEQTPAVFEKTFQTNALGPIGLIHRAWPLFKKQHHGRVINFASDSIYGMPNSTAYVMSKGALLGINKTLAIEGAAYGITVNCVAPAAASRQNERNFADLPLEQQLGFKETYTAESNVAMVLALAHSSNSITGECFSVGGFRVDRTVLGIVSGPKNVRSLKDCLEHTEEIVRKGKEIQELSSVVDLLAFKQR